jgi:hypothetical protein
MAAPPVTERTATAFLYFGDELATAFVLTVIACCVAQAATVHANASASMPFRKLMIAPTPRNLSSAERRTGARRFVVFANEQKFFPPVKYRGELVLSFDDKNLMIHAITVMPKAHQSATAT